MRIIATCMIAGPSIGLLVLYLVIFGIAAWASLQVLLSPVPAKGGSMVGMALAAALALFPIFAMIGTAAVALQTLLTGICLSIVQALKVPERVFKLLPAIPLACARFATAFAVGLAVSFVIAPSEAPKQLTNLGPLSLQFAAALSSGICYLIALRWSAVRSPLASPHQAARHGATQLTYADGSPMQEGDWVRTDGGKNLGRISAIIDSKERASARELQGFGVVVDAQPKGIVFLSDEYLREDPLQFVRRGPREQTRTHVAMAIGAAALLVVPALYSLFSATYSALSTGEVMVISLGRSETHREMVPWQMGWARFAGPLVLCASLCFFDGSRGVTLRWWLAGAGAIAGLILLCFSFWFASIGRATGILGFFVFVGAAALIDRWFGRGITLLFIVAGAVALVWRLTHAT